MKIGIDARLWDETGVGRYIRNLVYNLGEIDKTNEYVLFVKPGLKIKDLRFKNSNIKIVEANIRWHSLAEQIKFPEILNRENLDLMHFPYFSVPVFYNRPFVVTIHDLIIYHYSTGKASTLPLPYYQLKRFGYKQVLRHAVTHAQKVIVPLNTVKSDVLEHFSIDEQKVLVTYEGFDDKISTLNLPAGRQGSQLSTCLPAGKALNDKDYFLYVGNAYPHKNLARLIAGFVIFKKQTGDRETQLLLVGKDDYFYKRLHKYIKEKKISGVEFLHDVSDQELSSLYAHAKAFVSASLMEGFGLPALEAMANKCLVLVSDIPAFREVCQENALYFNPKNAEEIASYMEQISQKDRRFYKTQLANAEKRVKFFSWKKMAEETLKIYNSR